MPGPHRNRNRNRNRNRRSSSTPPPQWHDPMVDMLIEERRRRNEEYHSVYGRSRRRFWSSVARRFVCMIFYTFKKKLKI